MKTKNLLLLSIVMFNSVISFSQTNKNKFEISLNAGGYYDESLKGASDMNKMNITTIETNSDISFEFYFTEKFSMGIGTRFNYEYNQIYNILSEDTSFIQETVYAYNTFKNVFFAEFGYNFKIIKGLYIKPILTFNIYNENRDGSYVQSRITGLDANGFYDITDNNLVEINSNYEKINRHYFGVSLYPQIYYYVSKKFGFNIRVGNITSNNINDAIIKINTGVRYWVLGINFKL